MCAADKEVFSSFAHAQVSITNEIFQYLGEPDTFLFCPTGKMRWIHSGVKEEACYLTVRKAGLTFHHCFKDYFGVIWRNGLLKKGWSGSNICRGFSKSAYYPLFLITDLVFFVSEISDDSQVWSLLLFFSNFKLHLTPVRISYCKGDNITRFGSTGYWKANSVQ